MIELIQFPWSPFCIVQRRILEFAGVRFKITNLPKPYSDRWLVWQLTKQRYYSLPVVKDGRQVLFETAEDSQVIAKYLDNKFSLGLFPPELRGLQTILWRHIESEIEGLGFKLNDIECVDKAPARERLMFIRYKERKFGRGCMEQWRAQRDDMLRELAERLVPYEQMLLAKPFLLGGRPRFVDFNLFGMLANFLYSGRYELPAAHGQLRAWHARMTKARAADFSP